MEHEPMKLTKPCQSRTAAQLALAGPCPAPKGCSRCRAGAAATGVSNQVLLPFPTTRPTSPQVRADLCPPCRDTPATLELRERSNVTS